MVSRILLKVIHVGIIGIITLIFLSFLGSVMLNHLQGIHSVTQSINTHHIGWMVWRYTLMVVFIFFYPNFVRSLLARHDDMNDDLCKKYMRYRYAVLICIFYEVILVHNGLAWVINLLLRL